MASPSGATVAGADARGDWCCAAATQPFSGAIELTLSSSVADTKEFVKISQAVGVGFLVMGAVGYFVKLSM